MMNNALSMFLLWFEDHGGRQRQWQKASFPPEGGLYNVDCINRVCIHDHYHSFHRGFRINSFLFLLLCNLFTLHNPVLLIGGVSSS